MVETRAPSDVEHADVHDQLGVPQSEIAKLKEDLLQEMKVTKGCRFNASKRLERRDRRMITITAFASVYVILLTVLPLFFHVGEAINSAVNASIILFSLIILASSLLQYSNNDPVRAEQHHRCALEVSALRRELRATPDCSMATLAGFSKRYDELLQKYSINHDDVDFDKYRLEHPWEYQKSITDAEREESAKRVGREQRWAEKAVQSMTALAGIIAVGAGIASTYPQIADVLKKLVQSFGK